MTTIVLPIWEFTLIGLGLELITALAIGVPNLLFRRNTGSGIFRYAPIVALSLSTFFLIVIWGNLYLWCAWINRPRPPPPSDIPYPVITCDTYLSIMMNGMIIGLFFTQIIARYSNIHSMRPQIFPTLASVGLLYQVWFTLAFIRGVLASLPLSSFIIMPLTILPVFLAFNIWNDNDVKRLLKLWMLISTILIIGFYLQVIMHYMYVISGFLVMSIPWIITTFLCVSCIVASPRFE